MVVDLINFFFIIFIRRQSYFKRILLDALIFPRFIFFLSIPNDNKLLSQF